MNNFSALYDQFDREQVKDSIFLKTSQDVEAALLKKSRRNIEDFKALISPAAGKYLEQMAILSQQRTQKRFGRTVQLYAPLYVSNECNNLCTYCAFSFDNKIQRIVLTDEQLKKEISMLKEMGFDHVLIVTGEADNKAGMAYFRKVLSVIRPHFSHISFEVQPLDTEEYRDLISEGLNTVMVYQETYNKERYKFYHPKGKKANFYYRLETPDRLGMAGIYKIGIGILLGLGAKEQKGEGWRTDSFFCALHLDYLEKTYWKTRYSISFPRLRPIEIAGETNNTPGNSIIRNFDTGITDRELLQLICAYRIFNSEVELSLSTRESEKFRNNAIKLGITSMSAGSKTNPGGYSFLEQENNGSSLGQFEISDERSPAEISELLKNIGYETVWKDWDKALDP